MTKIKIEITPTPYGAYFADPVREDARIKALWALRRKHDMRIQAADALIVLSFLGLAMLMLEVL